MARWNRYRRAFADNSPRYITARFDSLCAETGKAIPKGTECLYFPQKRVVYSIGSECERWIAQARYDEEVLGKSYYRQS